jgi:hypothetical protein
MATRQLLDLKFDVAQLQQLSAANRLFLDLFTINERAIGGVEITDQDVVFGENYFAMDTGNRGIWYLQMIAHAPADAVDSGLKAQDPALFDAVGNKKSRHK